MHEARGEPQGFLKTPLNNGLPFIIIQFYKKNNDNIKIRIEINRAKTLY